MALTAKNTMTSRIAATMIVPIFVDKNSSMFITSFSFYKFSRRQEDHYRREKNYTGRIKTVNSFTPVKDQTFTCFVNVAASVYFLKNSM